MLAICIIIKIRKNIWVIKFVQVEKHDDKIHKKLQAVKFVKWYIRMVKCIVAFKEKDKTLILIIFSNQFFFFSGTNKI